MDFSDYEDGATLQFNTSAAKRISREVKTEGDDDEEEPRKKSKMTCQLSNEQEEELVEWFSAHPIFYDKSKRDFKDRGRREQLLEGKARELGLTGKSLASTSLRTQLLS